MERAESGSPSTWRDRVFVWIATGGGIGYAPFSPGTFGSLLGIPLHFGIARLTSAALPTVLLLAAAVAAACWIAGRADAMQAEHDSGSLVIDEIVGMAIALAGHGENGGTIALLFVLFRIFDVVKLWPANAIDARLPGGGGVVLDDVVSGVYANLTGRLLIPLIGM